jgi:hypothetical protein
VDLFDKKYCEEFICSPLHLNIDIRWINQAATKIVFGLFETRKFLHFKQMKQYSSKITLLMRFVEKADVVARQQQSTNDLNSYQFDNLEESGDDDNDDCSTNFMSFDGDTDLLQEGLGMDLKLYFDFGPILGNLSLVCIL